MFSHLIGCLRYYANRRDALTERRVYPAEGKIVCNYAPGRSKGTPIFFIHFFFFMKMLVELTFLSVVPLCASVSLSYLGCLLVLLIYIIVVLSRVEIVD